MEWLYENWVLVLVLGGMAAMHLFGHGHGKHKHGKTDKPHSGHEKEREAANKKEATSDDA